MIAACQKDGCPVYHEDKDTYSCYGMVGHMTLWVEYSFSEETFTLVNAYTHRMKIEMEAVWNGVKREDLL